MNHPRLRIPRSLSPKLVLMHVLLIALVAVVMVTSLPLSGMNG